VGIEYCWTSLVKTMETARNIAIEMVKFGATDSAILIMAIPNLNTPGRPVSE
jgi:hypothetical protein